VEDGLADEDDAVLVLDVLEVVLVVFVAEVEVVVETFVELAELDGKH
jgi:hypothetical protein